jgi:hypothetical protein
MSPLRAHVEKGRLVLDEPCCFPSRGHPGGHAWSAQRDRMRLFGALTMRPAPLIAENSLAFCAENPATRGGDPNGKFASGRAGKVH